MQTRTKSASYPRGPGAALKRDAMTLLDLRELTAPAGLPQWLQSHQLDSTVLEHQVGVDRDWWNQLFDTHGLPSDLLVGSTISRRQLFDLASNASTDPLAAERLLWNCTAWGLGNRPRLPYARIKSYLEDREGHQKLLMEAARLAQTDSGEAYAVLQPGRRPAIAYFGAGFFTKYLYAAGLMHATPSCLILDDRVVASLRSAGWSTIRRGGGWPVNTYRRYTELMASWAHAAGAARADLVELFLFEAAGNPDRLGTPPSTDRPAQL